MANVLSMKQQNINETIIILKKFENSCGEKKNFYVEFICAWIKERLV